MRDHLIGFSEISNKNGQEAFCLDFFGIRIIAE